jgi:hypothetical protein
VLDWRALEQWPNLSIVSRELSRQENAGAGLFLLGFALLARMEELMEEVADCAR